MIQRYDLAYDYRIQSSMMEPDTDGAYVRWEDVEALLTERTAERDAARAERDARIEPLGETDGIRMTPQYVLYKRDVYDQELAIHDQREAEHARLREALQLFGRHSPDCAAQRAWPASSAPCDCGLAALAAGAAATPVEE